MFQFCSHKYFKGNGTKYSLTAATKAPDFRLEKFQMEPNIINKSLPCADADESEVLHFGDGILAGIVYFGSRNWMGSRIQRSNKKPLQKNTKRTKTGER
jgi:hypothetical protein